jgi:hypothetical protein
MEWNERERKKLLKRGDRMHKTVIILYFKVRLKKDSIFCAYVFLVTHNKSHEADVYTKKVLALCRGIKLQELKQNKNK